MVTGMRVLVRLTADSDAAYRSDYHHKLRGCIWRPLEGTPAGDLHGDRTTVPFCFSNPFPVHETFREGEQYTVLISSPHERVLATLEERLTKGTPWNIGDAPFTVDSVTRVEPDVGEPGTSGVIQTDTGVYCRIPEEMWDEYGLDVPYNTDVVSWDPDMPLSVFMERLSDNLRWKHDTFCPDYLPAPDAAEDVFDSFDHQDTYSITTEVSTAQEWTFVVNKWRFEYTVRDTHHRRWLNLALETGLGWRNALGFGFPNIKEKAGESL